MSRTEYYQGLHEKGLCVRCHKPNDRKEFLTCTSCAKEQALYKIQRNERLYNERRCYHCGGINDRFPNRICTTCYDGFINHIEIWEKENPERFYEWNKEYQRNWAREKAKSKPKIPRKIAKNQWAKNDICLTCNKSKTRNPIDCKDVRHWIFWQSYLEAHKNAIDKNKANGSWSPIIRERHLRRNYRLTPLQYEQILSGQGGRCYFCPTTQDKHVARFGRRMPVDHDHKNGKVRGILCNLCNAALSGVEYFMGLRMVEIKSLALVIRDYLDRAQSSEYQTYIESLAQSTQGDKV